MTAAGPDDLLAENARLRSIIDALVERAEASEEHRTDFGIFQTTVLLEDQVRSRTRALDLALRELEEAHLALRQSREELQAIFDVVPNPLAVTDLDSGTFVAVSRSFAELFGTEPAEMLGRRAGPEDLGLWPTAEDRERFVQALDAGEGRVHDVPLMLPGANGSVSHLSVSGRLLHLGARSLLLTEFHDVTTATRDAQRLRDLALHDALTGLPNRTLLLDRLGVAMAQAQADGTTLAVYFADLDGFKRINDASGHAAGDDVLLEAARRLQGVVRGGDTVSRFGGDEFALLLTGLAHDDEAGRILERALAAVREPMKLPGFEGRVSVSLGYTLHPHDGDAAAPHVLLARADQAMYAAKTAGKDRVVRFRPDPAAD